MTCGGHCKLLPDLDGLAVLADDINTGRQVVEADVCAILDLCDTDESTAHSIDAQQSVAFDCEFAVLVSQVLFLLRQRLDGIGRFCECDFLKVGKGECVCLSVGCCHFDAVILEKDSLYERQ